MFFLVLHELCQAWLAQLQSYRTCTWYLLLPIHISAAMGPENLQESLLSNDTNRSKQSSQVEAAPVLCQDSEDADSVNESDALSYVTSKSESIDRGMYGDDDGASDQSPIRTRSESPGEEHVIVIAQPEGTAWRVDNSATDDDD